MDKLDLRTFAGRYFFISGSDERIAEGAQALIDAGARNFFTPFILGDRMDAAKRVAKVLNKLR